MADVLLYLDTTTYDYVCVSSYMVFLSLASFLSLNIQW